MWWSWLGRLFNAECDWEIEKKVSARRTALRPIPETKPKTFENQQEVNVQKMIQTIEGNFGRV